MSNVAGAQVQEVYSNRRETLVLELHSFVEGATVLDLHSNGSEAQVLAVNSNRKDHTGPISSSKLGSRKVLEVHYNAVGEQILEGH